MPIWLIESVIFTPCFNLINCIIHSNLEQRFKKAELDAEERKELEHLRTKALSELRLNEV